MSESNIFRESVKSKYGFADWAGRSKSFSGNLCRRFMPVRQEFDGYEFESRKAYPGFRHAFTENYRNISNTNVVIAVSIIEFDTILGAHDEIINRLSHCMATGIPKIEEKGINAGDIGFAGHAEVQSSLFFSRYNVFVHVHNVGEENVSIKEFAEKLDQQILDHQKKS